MNPDNGGLEHDFPDLTWVIFRCLSPLVFRGVEMDDWRETLDMPELRF